MTDRLGWRLKLGILVPAFNTTVQPELESMRPPGVTNHVARIEMQDLPLTSNDDQEMVIRNLGDDLFGAIRRVMIAKPAAVIVGISIPTFWGGVEGAGALLHRLEDAAGVPCIMGSVASVEALRLYPECTRTRRSNAVSAHRGCAGEPVSIRIWLCSKGARFPEAAIES